MQGQPTKQRVTPEIKREIKDRYQSENISKRKLGRDYGLTAARVDKILSEEV